MASGGQASQAVNLEADDDLTMGEPIQVLGDDEKGYSTPRAHGEREKEREGRPATGFSPEYKKMRQEQEEDDEEAPPNAPGQSSKAAMEGPPGLVGHPMTPPDAQAQPTLSLKNILDTVKQGFSRVDSRFDEVKGDLYKEVGKLRREQGETKDIATKALTTADSTKKEMQNLSKRVAALEKGEGPRGRGLSVATPGSQAVGYNSLGGEAGNEMIVGTFDQYASRDERKANWEKIRSALPEDIDSMIEKIEAPGLRNKIIIATIKSSPEGVAKTRENLLSVLPAN